MGQNVSIPPSSILLLLLSIIFDCYCQSLIFGKETGHYALSLRKTKLFPNISYFSKIYVLTLHFTGFCKTNFVPWKKLPGLRPPYLFLLIIFFYLKGVSFTPSLQTRVALFGNSWGKSYTKFIMVDIKFCFTCGKSDLY